MGGRSPLTESAGPSTMKLIPSDPQRGRGEEGVQRLRQARLRSRLSTDELLALCRGEED